VSLFPLSSLTTAKNIRSGLQSDEISSPGKDRLGSVAGGEDEAKPLPVRKTAMAELNNSRKRGMRRTQRDVFLIDNEGRTGAIAIIG